MTNRELAREIQSQNKGFKAPWMNYRDWKKMVYDNGDISNKEFDEYCEEMSGDVKVYKLEDISKKKN